MRIAFAGTPEFAATALQAMIQAGLPVGLVLSQPDRPAGRGQRMQASAVKQLAMQHGIEVLTPISLRPEKGGPDCEHALERLRLYDPDVLVVAAYGLLLPQAVLDLPRGLPVADGTRAGALNIHASLLPRWRGAAPIVRAIQAGDSETGVTLMQMDVGLDTGPMLAKTAVPIPPEVTGARLTQQLAELGANMIVSALQQAQSGQVLRAQAQPSEGVTYARKLDKSEAWMDWSLPARALVDQVRAFDPFPGACSQIDGHICKIWAAAMARPELFEGRLRAAVPAGTVLERLPEGVLVACGAEQGQATQAVLLTELQRPGGKRLPAGQFLAGLAAGPAIVPGACWGHPNA